MRWKPAGLDSDSPVFRWFGETLLEDLLDRAEQFGAPQVAGSKAGVYCFAVPLKLKDSQVCLAGCGLRNSPLDLVSVEKLAAETGSDPVKLLQELEALPVGSFGGLSEIAARVMSLIRLLIPDDSGAGSMVTDHPLLELAGQISTELDQSASARDLLALLSESLGLMFDLAGVSIICKSSAGWQIEKLYGIAFDRGDIPKNSAHLLATKKAIHLSPGDVAELLPAAAGSCGALIPMNSCGRSFGCLLLLGERFSHSSLLLQELIAGRGALRLAVLEKESELVEKNLRSQQMLELFTRLAAIDDLPKLASELLEGVARLSSAESGSLMLRDSQSEVMTIAAARGMNPALARSLKVRVGQGISGHVALHGTALIIDDIDNDSRFTPGRRPRFKTGSCICMPLIWKSETLGVLNLSDKSDGRVFDLFDLESIAPVVDHAASLIFRIRAGEGARDLERLSITDPLTELYNRRFLERRMEEELARCNRHGLALSVMMLDLDRFKLYNDLYGHQAGDDALRKVSEILRSTVREIDVVTRYGGEEFCILLPDTPKVDALYVAERIRYGIENGIFPGEDALPSGGVTVSIGLASYPDNGTSATELLSSADSALYQAKGAGRNRVTGSDDLPGIPALRGFNSQRSVQFH